MPLYHKKTKTAKSFVSPLQNYTAGSLSLDKINTTRSFPEKPLDAKSYSRKLADVLAKSAESDEKYQDEKKLAKTVVEKSDSGSQNTSRIDAVTSPQSDSIFFSSPVEFESVEISTVKTVGGKTVKSLARVESSTIISNPNTDANMISIPSQPNDSPKSIKEMLNDCVSTNLRLSQQLMNVDDPISPKKDEQGLTEQFPFKMEPQTQTTQHLKNTLSRFISNLNFIMSEPKTQTTQNTQQFGPKVFDTAETPSENVINNNENDFSHLEEKTVDVKKANNQLFQEDLESNSMNIDKNTPNTIEEKLTDTEKTKKGSKSKSPEIKELTEFNQQLSQKYFNCKSKNNKNKPNASEENVVGTKKAKTDPKKSREIKDLTEFNEDLSQEYFPSKSKNIGKNKLNGKSADTKKTKRSPKTKSRELEEAAELNERLSQEYFPKKPKIDKKAKSKRGTKKNKNDFDEDSEKENNLDTLKKARNKVAKKSEGVESYTELNNKISKKGPKKRKAENVLKVFDAKKKMCRGKESQRPTKPKMIHTSKKAMDRYKSESFINRMIELQNLRNVGIYVFCDSCDKIRYLSDVKDPLQLPDKWNCHMNPDKEYNSCQAPNYDVPPQDESRLLETKFNAGSIVWAKLEGYPWWPAMVEDDPDVEDYYWLEDDERDQVPTWYHVTFFDTQKVTRAWIKTKNLEPFEVNLKNRYFLPANHDIFKHRIKESIVQALNACEMDLLPRLRKYSFITRYIKPKETKNVKKSMNKISNCEKSDENCLQKAKPKKICRSNKIYSDDLEDDILKDVDLNHFINQETPDINFNNIDEQQV